MTLSNLLTDAAELAAPDPGGPGMEALLAALLAPRLLAAGPASAEPAAGALGERLPERQVLAAPAEDDAMEQASGGDFDREATPPPRDPDGAAASTAAADPPRTPPAPDPKPLAAAISMFDMRGDAAPGSSDAGELTLALSQRGAPVAISVATPDRAAAIVVATPVAELRAGLASAVPALCASARTGGVAIEQIVIASAALRRPDTRRSARPLFRGAA